MIDLSALSEPFPPEDIHWRVQGKPFERNGKHSAMALAYLDARDVMDRLDAVCGPAGWQSHFEETAKGRIICRLSIRIGDEWVTKSDGAGDTDVEGEKGALSDALKRAAVSWGIGRYLYRLTSPWVACEVNDKGAWRRWTEDPWAKVKGAPKAPLKPPEAKPDTLAVDIATAKENAAACTDMAALGAWYGWLWKNANDVAAHPDVIAAKDARKAQLSEKDAA